jgi:hypothetical protein
VAQESQRNRKLDAAVDQIHARFGRNALARASTLDAAATEAEKPGSSRKPAR